MGRRQAHKQCKLAVLACVQRSFTSPWIGTLSGVTSRSLLFAVTFFCGGAPHPFLRITVYTVGGRLPVRLHRYSV